MKAIDEDKLKELWSKEMGWDLSRWVPIFMSCLVEIGHNCDGEDCKHIDCSGYKGLDFLILLEQGKDFNAWHKTHSTDKEQTWYVQNCLGDLYPNSENHKQAVKAWQDTDPLRIR